MSNQNEEVPTLDDPQKKPGLKANLQTSGAAQLEVGAHLPAHEKQNSVAS